MANLQQGDRDLSRLPVPGHGISAFFATCAAGSLMPMTSLDSLEQDLHHASSGATSLLAFIAVATALLATRWLGHSPSMTAISFSPTAWDNALFPSRLVQPLVLPAFASIAWVTWNEIDGPRTLLLAIITLLFAFTLAITGRRWLLLQKGRIESNARKHERERIARELHDTLLQGTQGLVMTVQAATLRLPARHPVRLTLEQALSQADKVMAEGRDRIQGMRQCAQPPRDLPKLLADAGEELRVGRPQDFRILVDGNLRPVDPFIADEAFLIVREALANSFQHADATLIEMRIAYGRNDLLLCVSDDGHGMDLEALAKARSPGHWGIRGMRERAENLPAQLQIRSCHGQGTEVELLIGARIAYR